MTLEEQIKDRIVAYYVRGGREIAFELSLLHLTLAERRIARERVASACRECIRWLELSGFRVPDHLPRVSCWMQREELKNILAKARVADLV